MAATTALEAVGFDEVAPEDDDRGYVADSEDAPDAAPEQMTFTPPPTEDEEAAFRARYGLRPLDQIDHSPPEPLLLGYIDPIEHTILFGPGGIGKGVNASHAIVGLRRDYGRRVLIIDFESHEREWARRIRGLAGPDYETIEAGIRYVAPLSREWNDKKGALWEIVEPLSAMIRLGRIDFLVIDSIVMACGGKDVSTGDTETPTRYTAALQELGVPALSLGHTNRAGDPKYPFGSVFWHNTARVTWSMAEHHDGSVKLTNRKASNYPRLPAQVQTAAFNRDGMLTHVDFQIYAETVAERITQMLEEAGPLDLDMIYAQINENAREEDAAIKRDTIRRELQRGLTPTKRKPQLFTVDDKGRYSLCIEQTGTFRDAFSQPGSDPGGDGLSSLPSIEVKAA